MTRKDLERLVFDTGCAVAAGNFVFLCDPHGSAAERSEITALLERARSDADAADRGWLALRTGGTSGGVKFARHDERTLLAAVRGFCTHFGLVRANAVNVLPPFHVSGLMPRVRCAVTGGTHLAWDWKRLEAGEFPDLKGDSEWTLSLVPTQLQRLLTSASAVAWLRRLQVIFLGGGPVWPGLADRAAQEGLRISLSYGLTETAAMVAALLPTEFLAGARSSGRALPHMRIEVERDGRIVLEGDSLFCGYVGMAPRTGPFRTEDRGRIDPDGQLHVVGRIDEVVISGGKKVSPAEVEAALRASGEFTEVVVIGMPDAEWGEALVACYPPGEKSPDVARATASLAGYQRPKRFLVIDSWPQSSAGKIDRAEIRRRVGHSDLGLPRSHP